MAIKSFSITIALFIIATLTFNNINSQNLIKETNKANVQENKKSYSSYIFTLQDGNITKCRRKIDEVVFDCSGKLSEKKIYNKDGELRAINRYKYSDTPHKEISTYTPDNKLKRKTVFMQDKEGKILSAIHYNDKNKIIRRTEEIYKNDLVVQTRSYKENKLSRIINYKYDENNFNVVYEQRDGNNRVIRTLISINNSNGDPIESLTYFGKDSLVDHSYFTYDKHNNFSEIKSVNTKTGKTEVSNFNYTYDKQNRITQLIKYINHRVLFKTSFQYDDDGNVVEKKDWNSTGQLKNRIISKYDKTGLLLREENHIPKDNKIIVKQFIYQD